MKSDESQTANWFECISSYALHPDLEENQVRFENIGNTKSFCDFTDKEKAFFSLLPISNNYVIEGDSMYVYHDMELLLTFKRK